jgi:hypothetical protein
MQPALDPMASSFKRAADYVSSKKPEPLIRELKQQSIGLRARALPPHIAISARRLRELGLRARFGVQLRQVR